MSSCPSPIPNISFSAMPTMQAPIPPTLLPIPHPPPAPPPEDSVEKPPRPPNAWIIFRREMSRRWPPELRINQSKMSSQVKVLWVALTPDERAVWDRLAEEAKAEHKLKYPNYKYCPMKKEEKLRLQQVKKQAQLEKKLAKRAASKGASSSRAAATGPVPVAKSARQSPYYIPALAQTHAYHPGGPSPAMSYVSLPDEEDEAPLTPSTANVAPSVPSSPFPATALVAPATTLPFPIAGTVQLPEAECTDAQLQEDVSNIFTFANVEVEASVEYNNDIDVSWTHFGDEASVDSYEWPTPVASSSNINIGISSNTRDNINNWLNESGFSTQISQLASIHGRELIQTSHSPVNYFGDIEINCGPCPSYSAPEEFYGNIFDFGQQEEPVADISWAQFLSAHANPQDILEFTLPAFSDAFPVHDQFFGSTLQPLDNGFSLPMDFASSSSTNTYTPPAGAANSGLRRVGGYYQKVRSH